MIVIIMRFPLPRWEKNIQIILFGCHQIVLKNHPWDKKSRVPARIFGILFAFTNSLRPCHAIPVQLLLILK